MPKTYKIGNEVYDIPDNEAAAFLSDNPNAIEVQSFVSERDTFDIPLSEVESFMKEFPNAKPLKGASPEVGAASGDGSNAPQEPSSLSGTSNEYQAKLNKMNFVQRFNQPEKFIQNKDGSRSTHKMASANVDNKNIAFPTIVEKNGKLIELSVDDAIDHAMKTGEFAEFATEQDAQQWAEGGYKEGTGLQPSLPSGIREVAIKAATGDPAAMAAMEWYKNNSNKKPEQKITGKITIADPEKIPFTERKKAAEFARSKGVNIPDYEKKGNETDVEAATRNVEYKNAKAQTEGLQNIQRTTTPEALSVAEKNFKSNLGKGKEEVVAAQDKLQTEVDRAAYDYIRSTSSPENAQYEISKYSTIANKKKNGEELTDAEIEYLFDTRKKSVSQLANESFAKAYETEQSGDFDEYAKDMAKINSIAKGLSVAGKVDVSAVDGYYKNYKTISDALKTSVESATSEYNSKIADIQKMYDNKEISDYEADQLAKEAKAVYDDAFNKYETDSKEVYGKYVSEVGGINEKLKQENNKQQANLNVINSMLEDTRQRTNVDDFKIEELNKQYKAANDLSKAVKTLDVMDNEAYVMQEEKRMIAEQEKEDPTVVGQFTKGFIRSLGGAVMNLGQLPQVITSALGDTDYSAEDVFADAIEEKKNNPVFRPLPKDAPEYLKAGYDLGSAVGSITSFAVGGQSKAAVAGIAFLTTEPDAFREALETGMDRDDAAIYSSFISSLTALSEGIIPDGKYFAATARASVLRAIKNGKGVKDAISSALKELPKSAESYIETFGKEGLEEGTTNIIGSTGETLVDQVEGKSYYGGFDVESLKKDILLGAAAGGFMNAFRRGTPKSKVEESAAFDMVENRDYIVDNLEQVDPETATEVKEQLDAAKENLDALKTHSNWDKLSEDEKAHAFALTQQAAALKEQEKIAAVQIEDKAKQEQIKAIEEELNTIFNEREEQTTTEEPQETTKIDGESEQQDLPTEGEATNEEVQPTEAERVEQGKKNVESKKADIERRRQEELFDILSEEDKQIALKIPEGDKRNKWVKTRVSKTTKGNDAIERHNAEDALNTSTDVATRIAAKRKLESNQPFNAGSISDINNVIFKIKNDDVLIGSEKLIKDYYDAELKALEQKQSTETKVEASNTSNVEEGSVGVGGDVVKPTFENVPILTRTAEEIETAKNEVFNNLNRLEVGSVIENSDGEIKVVTEKSTDKKGNQLIGIVTYERQSDGSLRQMTNIVWASKSADGKIKLDYNPHSTGTNLKGERVTVTDQITDKKIDLSKENIFTEDENGNLIQINKVEPSLKEAPESGSVGVGGDVKVNKKLALENAEKIDNGDGSHVKKMSMQELKELAMDMSENEKEYQEKFEDAQGIYNLTTERIEELEQSKAGSVGVGGDENAWGSDKGLTENFYTTDVDGYAIKKPITNPSSVTIDGVDFHIAKVDGDWKVIEKKSGLEISTGKISNTKNAAIEDATIRLAQNGGAKNLPKLIDRAIQGFKDRNTKAGEEQATDVPESSGSAEPSKESSTSRVLEAEKVREEIPASEVEENADGSITYDGIKIKRYKLKTGTTYTVFGDAEYDGSLTKEQREKRSEILKELNEQEQYKKSQLDIAKSQNAPVSFRYSEFPKSRNGEPATARNYIQQVDKIISQGGVLDEKSLADYEKKKTTFGDETKATTEVAADENQNKTELPNGKDAKIAKVSPAEKLRAKKKVEEVVEETKTTEPTTEPTQKVDEGDALKNNEKPKTLNEKIQYIASKAGVSFTKSKNTNSWYGKIGNKAIRISDHPSKFTERAEKQGVPSIDLSLEYYHPDAIVHLINDTDPFEKYTNGDVITHSSEKIGDVTYLGSDYKKGYVEVETKDGRVVKYNMEKFLGKNYQEAPLDNVSKIEEKIDTTAEQVEPIDTTLFEEFDAINKSRSISERAAKRKEFEAKHGEMAAKIKDITTNFDTYIKQLKDEGVIKNVDCE